MRVLRSHTRGSIGGQKIHELTVGEEYLIFKNRRYVQFIQVTPKGYNFVDLETSRCVLKGHLYLSKKERVRQNIGEEDKIVSAMFYLPRGWKIEEIKKSSAV